jgi:hypothetical protein
VLFVLLLC